MQRRVENNRPAPGPLSAIVRRSRESGLEQYLLLHALASNNDEGTHDVRLPATTWARAIGGYIDPATGVVEPAALHAVSRNWRFLEQLRLVARQRVGRRARVWLLADDGSGDPYVHPGAGARGKQLDDGPGYLQLPYAYWRERWHERLSLPAKAVLLVALTLGDGFPLPYGQFPSWYGFSSSTGERGLAELRELGLLHREQHRRPDPESPVGYADVYHYALLAPFGPRDVRSKAAPPLWAGPSSSRPVARRTKAKRVQPRTKDRAQAARGLEAKKR